MRFLGLGLWDRVPDARTIWLFREKLTKAGAVASLFARFDATPRAAGYMSGQIVDATLVQAPRQRNTQGEKADIKADRIPDEWEKRPTKLRHKDRDARWTVRLTKTKPVVDLAIPAFGYRNHIAIDRRFGLIRTWLATDAAARREGLLDKTRPLRRSEATPPTARRSLRPSLPRTASVFTHPEPVPGQSARIEL